MEYKNQLLVLNTNTNVTVSNKFNQILDMIPVKLSLCNDLLAEYKKNPTAFLNAHDESEIDEILSDLKELHTFTSEIKATRKEVKSFLNQKRDELLKQLDNSLNSAGFDSLIESEKDMKVLKNDLSHIRLEERWKEIETVYNEWFESAMGKTIIQNHPKLANFEKFRNIHQSLVSGAKTRNITKKDKTFVRDTLTKIAEGIFMIEQNPWNLENKLYLLMDDYENNPNYENLHSKGLSYKAQEDKEKQIAFEQEKKKKEQEELAKKKAEEDERKKQKFLAKQKTMQNIAKKLIKPQPVKEPAKPQPTPEIQKYITPIIKQDFPASSDYILNSGYFNNLHSSPKEKANLIALVARSIADMNSPFYKDINNNETKFLSLIQTILNI